VTRDEMKPVDRYLSTLERRASHLEARIADYRGVSDSWDRAELAAVRWAINVCRATFGKEHT
jgi:hypothetical protein